MKIDPIHSVTDPLQFLYIPTYEGRVWLNGKPINPAKRPPTPPDQNEQLKPFLDVCRPLGD